MTLLLEAPRKIPAPPPPVRAKGDPRVPFAVMLTVYAVMGTMWLGFNRRPEQILLTVAAGCALEMLLHALLKRRELMVPLSAYISSLSIALLLNYAHDPFLLFLPVFLTVGSKYLITYRGSHVFNPSLFGVAVTLLATGGLITTAPAYQWGGSWAMSIFIAAAALSLFVFRVGRGWLIVSFLVFYSLQTALRAWFMRAHLPPEMLFLGTLSTPPFFLFVFYMMTDPKTSPPTRRGQIYTALAVTLIDLYLHTKGSVFTFFYAAFAVQAAKFFAWHAGDAWREGVARHLRDGLGSARTLRTAAVLSLMAMLGGAGYRVVRPHVALTDAGFRLEAVPAETSGLRWAMDPKAYDTVDPRLHHVSKWLLSVGSSVEAADVDGDGRPDLFVTSPLAVPGSKAGMYLNRGGMKFERIALPLDSLEHAHTRHGIASGGVFFDYDADGDQDLLVLVSFGTPRLLRNTLTETGRPGFEDVSQRAGLSQYTISVSANVLDYDRDGHPDILIGNVLAPYLPDYADSTRLDIFRLPQPAHEGDRRMFRFMHDGWHNATNGGRNVLLRNRGDGTFQEMDAAAMGMPETHWTISVGTGDFNADGWTDLYLASDFGRDDLYLNERGRRFRRVAGRMFGDVGMDTYKGMNSTVADFDRDGRLDVYVSNVHQALQAEGSLLWMNRGVDDDGTPRMRDEASARGALNPHRFGWGAGAGDLDNDGWPDLVQANGMVGDRLDGRYPGCPDYWYVNHKLMQAGPEIHTYADMWGDLRGRCIYPDEAIRVYLNRGDAAPQFVDVAELAGLRGGDNTRGVAMADLDDDGRVDVAVSSQHGLPHLLRNVPSARSAGHGWIGVRLVGGGPGCTRDALGSTVSVRIPGEPPQTREVQAANGFASQADARVHFGLGAWRGEVPVEVRWCGRETARYRLAPDRYHTLTR